MRDILELDALGQAELIRTGEITAEELMHAVLDRIESTNPEINAVCELDRDSALLQAKNPRPGPFSGVPFLVKDTLAWPGMTLTLGSRLFAENLNQDRPPYIDCIEASGLITIGKTTTSEFGLLGSTETLLHGVTRNPIDRERSAGGSSGGAAAAVAAGMVPMAHGSDGGGSLRIPASACGLFAFKPGSDRTCQSLMYPEPSPIPMYIDHCISRSVRDSACFLSVTERTDADAPLKPLGFLSEARGRKFRIGYYTNTAAGTACSGDALDVLLKTVDRCRQLGHDLVEIASPIVPAQKISDAFFTFAGSGLQGVAEMMKPSFPDGIGADYWEPFTLYVLEMFRKTGQEELKELAAVLHETKHRMTTYPDKVDITLCPTQPYAAQKLGYLNPNLDPELLLERTLDFAGYTVLHSIAGAPAMSVPLFTTQSGLPLGSHFGCSYGKEDMLFELAYQLTT